jgi:hypothetical protein
MADVRPRLGGQERVGLVDPDDRGKRGVTDLGLGVVEHRAEPPDRAPIAERGHRAADRGAGGLVLLTTELEQ